MDTKYSFNNNTSRISTLCIFVIFIYFLMISRCWIGFSGRTQIMSYIFPFLMILFYQRGMVRLKIKRRYVVFVIILFLASLFEYKTTPNIFGLVGKAIPAFNILLVLIIKDAEKEYVLAKVIKWFGLIMAISILFYIGNLITSLPSLGVITADYGDKNSVAGEYFNYLFYIHPTFSSTSLSFHRFNGPFIEPGDVGCLTAFLLMAARFDFKRYKYLWIVLLSLLLSLSLAGYLLTLFAYLSKFLYEGKRKLILISSVSVVVLGVLLFGSFYNGGDNVINETVISRLQEDEDRGFSGNNRTTAIKTEYFIMMFNDTHTMLFGYDKGTLKMLNESGLGAGVVNYSLVVGMVGLFALILPYLYMALRSNSRKYAWLFFFLFLLYLSQRTDALWISIVMCYVYGIVIHEKDILVRVV